MTFNAFTMQYTNCSTWMENCTIIIIQQILSFILAISIAPLQVLYYSEALPTTAQILYRSFTLKRTGKGLAQGPYMAARAGVEPTTLRLKVIASTNAPRRPTTNRKIEQRLGLNFW